MAITTSLTKPHTMGAILVHFFKPIKSYLVNNITNILLIMFNCLGFVGIIRFFIQRFRHQMWGKLHHPVEKKQ